MKEERDIAVAVILSIVTCGIYGIYWFIVMTDEVKTARDNAVLYLILQLLGLSIVNHCLIQNDLNELVRNSK